MAWENRPYYRDDASFRMRFGFTPLYLGMDDILGAAAILEEIMGTRAWDDPRFRVRGAVT